MAYRRSNGKGRRTKKVEPAVLTMVFEIPLTGDGVTDQHTIDLSQCASLVNRRFYRQGINWAVSGFKFLTQSNTLGTLAVKKLPSTWVMSNSWMKGFNAWQKMNNEALEESESVRPRFLDFKIYADSMHHTAGFGANLLPGVQEPGFVQATPGEWEASKYHIPDTTGGATGDTKEREVIAVGTNYPGAGASGFQAVSLIEGYAASRGLPDVLDPNAPADAADADGTQPANWQAALFNEGTQQTEEIIEDMIAENNIAPYPFENDGVHVDTMYPGGANQLNGLQFHDSDFVTATTIGGVSRLKGGMFPCGLVRLQVQKTSAGSSTAALLIDLVPGHHRGYLCEPMTEM